MLQSNTHLPNMYKLRNSSFRLSLSIFFLSEGQLYSLPFGIYPSTYVISVNGVRMDTIWMDF